MYTQESICTFVMQTAAAFQTAHVYDSIQTLLSHTIHFEHSIIYCQVVQVQEHLSNHMQVEWCRCEYSPSLSPGGCVMTIGPWFE